MMAKIPSTRNFSAIIEAHNKICGNVKAEQDKLYSFLGEKGVGKLKEHIKKTKPDDYKAIFKLAKDIIGKKNDKDNRARENEELNRLLDDRQLPKDYLDQGFNEEKGVWWNGFELAGKPAILLSDGKVLRDLTQQTPAGIRGVNEILEVCNYQGYIGTIAPTLRNQVIRRYIAKFEGESQANLVKPADVYKNIKDAILYYMDFDGKEETADVLACWVISTYCYELFDWFPHILFNAPSGSGKSKCGNLLTQLSFRGFDLGASGGVTPAIVFRTLEGNRGTILIDEYEQSPFEAQAIVNQILNASAMRDASIIRCEKVNKKWTPHKFPIFCPKIVCNISGINPTSLSRFIAVQLLKTIDKDKHSRKPYNRKDKEKLKPYTDDCYHLILENWKEIKESYDTFLLDEFPNLKNREADNWKPLIAMARFVDGGVGGEIEGQLLKYLEKYEEISITHENNERELFEILYNTLSEGDVEYSPKELSEWEAIKDLTDTYKSPTKWIGRRLKSYGLRPRRLGSGMKYMLSQGRILRIIERFFPEIKPPAEKPEVSVESEKV